MEGSVQVSTQVEAECRESLLRMQMLMSVQRNLTIVMPLRCVSTQLDPFSAVGVLLGSRGLAQHAQVQRIL